jgi:hypothetical protein
LHRPQNKTCLKARIELKFIRSEFFPFTSRMSCQSRHGSKAVFDFQMDYGLFRFNSIGLIVDGGAFGYTASANN